MKLEMLSIDAIRAYQITIITSIIDKDQDMFFHVFGLANRRLMVMI